MFKISIQAEEIEKMPLGSFPGEIKVIDSPGLEYAAAIAYLMTQKVIGFDTETKPVFAPGHPHNNVALLQLSGKDKAFLFRVNKLGMRRLMCSILSNPSIIKVGAAVHDDIRGLQIYRKFTPKAFVDLQKIAWEWGIRDKSVKKMAAIILGCKISKTQQLSNWEADELSEAQKMYAATDAWICTEMYRKLCSSEKHPLTQEQLNPVQNQPSLQVQDKKKSEGAKEPGVQNPAPKKKRRPRKRHPRRVDDKALQQDKK